MSTPGSVRSGDASPAFTPPAPGAGTPGPHTRKRTRVFRWEGIIPAALGLVLLAGGWLLFGERIVRGILSEAGTKALGAQLDIAGVDLGFGTVRIGGVALADPFDVNRNLFEVSEVRIEIQTLPLLEKKLVIDRFSVTDVRTGTRRAVPAEPVTGSGFAPRALNEMRRFASQFQVPLLSLTPFDTLKAIALDPSQLKAVQAAVALGQGADSVKQAIEQGYASLRLQETLDSSAALVSRMQQTNVRTLGLDGARKAVTDVRAAIARVDAAKARVDGLVADARRGSDTLQARLRAIDDARREDYAFARGLLKLPAFEGPEIGSALFGRVTIDRFQRVLYWATLAREHAPPGLLPKEEPGPKRLRRAGSTIQFAAREELPRFHLRRAEISADISGGTAAGRYAIAASDLTTEPALVGRPMLFAARRLAGGDVDSLRVTGSLDHLGERPRDVVNVQAAGVKLPTLALPVLPYRLDAGRGASELRLVLDGDRLSGRWTLKSSDISWLPDSSRSRRLNDLESLVARALTGIDELDLAAEVGGTLQAPRLSVRTNLDRQVADRLKAVMGEEIAKAQAKVRAHVDQLVEEKAAPVRARIAEARAESDRRLADARAKLDEEKRKLEERLKALSGGLVGLPRLPG